MDMAAQTCPHCDTKSYLHPAFGIFVDRAQGRAAILHACVNCGGASTVTANIDMTSIYHGDSDEIIRAFETNHFFETWEPKKATWPSFDDVPAHIAQAASEAFACHSIGANHASVMIARAVVEAAAKDQGATAGSLVKKIEALHEDGKILKVMADAAHEIRYAGNDAAHGDFTAEPVDEADAEELLDFMSEFLRNIYATSARVGRWQKRREGKKQS